MKIYDFSSFNFDNDILSKKSTQVILSERFDYKGNEEVRVIVANQRKNKRLVFLINSGEVIEQTRYSDAEKESVMNCLDGMKEKLLSFID